MPEPRDRCGVRGSRSRPEGAPSPYHPGRQRDRTQQLGLLLAPHCPAVRGSYADKQELMLAPHTCFIRVSDTQYPDRLSESLHYPSLGAHCPGDRPATVRWPGAGRHRRPPAPAWVFLYPQQDALAEKHLLLSSVR